MSGAGYGGDIGVREAWKALQAEPAATLIDVRTAAEWTFVGVPDLQSIGKATLFVAWNEYPGGVLPDFAARLRGELGGAGISEDAPLYFLCRSGQRSRSAAMVATEAGFGTCFNVVEGFEGHLGPDGHRATEGSWKAEGLPWTQS